MLEEKNLTENMGCSGSCNILQKTLLYKYKYCKTVIVHKIVYLFRQFKYRTEYRRILLNVHLL